MSRWFFYAVLLTAGVQLNTQAAITGNNTFESFDKAKRILLQKVYADHQSEFYCDNPFNTKKEVIPQAKGYQPRGKSRRTTTIEWEHIVPAEAFGQSFPEWRKGHKDCIRGQKPYKGRACADKLNAEYRHMQADLYNLVPAIGELNGLRSNYSYAMIPGEERQFGSCDFEVQDQKVEPREQVRGDIARTYFYMEAAYPGRGIVSGKNRKLLEAWDRMDPVDTWECTRASRIEALQKNVNPFVKSACQKKGLN
jgi:deoxyribonuclease-1